MDYAKGGPTAQANLGPACRHHNLDHPTGHHYEVPPEPATDPTPDPITTPTDNDPPPF